MNVKKISSFIETFLSQNKNNNDIIKLWKTKDNQKKFSEIINTHFKPKKKKKIPMPVPTEKRPLF